MASTVVFNEVGWAAVQYEDISLEYSNHASRGFLWTLGSGLLRGALTGIYGAKSDSMAA